jgi:hypothetical protein
MTTYQAFAHNQRTGHIWRREVPSADNGARQLIQLMVAHGWLGDADETAGALARGDRIEHKGFSYWVEATVLGAERRQVERKLREALKRGDAEGAHQYREELLSLIREADSIGGGDE